MKTTTLRSVGLALAVALCIGMATGCGCSDSPKEPLTEPLSEMASLVEEAYIYGLPLIMSYQTMMSDAVDTSSPTFKAPFNQLKRGGRIEESKDTVGSTLWMDLRAEPVVLTVPDMAGEWVYSIELQDLTSSRFGQIGTQALGNDEGNYLVAGPSWEGKAPNSIAKVFRSDTDFASAVYRTRYPAPEDRPPVLAIQRQFKARPLSSFIVSPAVEAAPAIDFLPWSESALGDDFIATLNFCLPFIQPNEAEQALWAKWAPIGVGPGKPFDFNSLSPAEQKDIQTGVQSALAKMKVAEPES
jgi:hypothetical protein